MASSLRLPILGVLLAIAITTTMDATGLTVFSALPLLPLMGIFWSLERLSRKSVGFAWSRWPHYGLAVLHPIVVIGALLLIVTATGAADLARTHWSKAWLNFARVAAATIPGAAITEEGFFRGWLWASLERAGQPPKKAIAWTSAAFALWHVSAVSLKTGFDLPAERIPIFLLNVAAIGVIWGLMRWISGSLLVTSVSHGVWNGGAYVFFGFGTKVGALGVHNTALFGPEVGLLGLALNVAFAAALWLWTKRRPMRATSLT